MSIIKSFPKEWNRIMQFESIVARESLFTKITKPSEKIANVIRNEIVSELTIKNRPMLKWEKILDRDFSDDLWRKITLYVYEVTNCTKLRWFQFRQINNVITTNVMRSKWDGTITPSCYFCQNSDETIHHLFVLCPIVQKYVWKPLKRWLYHHCFLDFNIEMYDILLLRYRDSCKNLVNTIILIAKQYIYATKCLKRKLNFAEIMFKVNEYRTIELVSAIKANKKKIHQLKWSMYDKV